VGDSASASTGLIVVAEELLHDLLRASGVSWDVQPCQPSVAAMWQGLSSGALNQRSRILVFSDSLMADVSTDQAERQQTARAAVAMAKAGAVVAIAQWRPDRWPEFEAMLAAEAASQEAVVEDLPFVILPVHEGGRAVLEALRPSCESLATFPVAYPDDIAALLPGAGPAATTDQASLADADGENQLPVLPPMTATPAAAPPLAAPSITITSDAAADAKEAEPEPSPRDPEYPPNASLELLDQPKRPGQLTITVTSSKGGSGKSTVSILLAATIAHQSAAAGRPLSVCVLDLDTRDGQIASLIGKFMPTALNLRIQPVWDEDRIRRTMVSASGLDVDTMLAPIRPRTADTVGPEFYRTLVRSLQRMYDVVIMDTSVQYLEPLIAEVALVEADEVLFVTTLAATAIQGMARALREITAPIDESGLGIPRDKVGIVVNQSVANVGMDREQVLAAGLGVPVVGVIPLATRDVLTATNLNNMAALLTHPLLGPSYTDLAKACLRGHEIADWTPVSESAADSVGLEEKVSATTSGDPEAGRRRGLFRR